MILRHVFLLFCLSLLASLKADDYLVTINGVSSEVESGKESVVVLPDGQALRVTVSPKRYVTYSGTLCSFEYSSGYKPEISTDKDGNTTATFMSRSGASMVVQEFRSMSPEGMVDIVMNEITKEEIAYGYSSVERKILQSAGGVTFSGKEVTTTYGTKEKIYRVFANRGKDEGVLIIVFFNKENTAPAEDVVAHLWKTMKIRKQANELPEPTAASGHGSS